MDKDMEQGWPGQKNENMQPPGSRASGLLTKIDQGLTEPCKNSLSF